MIIKAKEVRLKLDCHGNAAYCMNIESEESTMNRESQSLKRVAGASAAHAQQIPIPQYGCPSHGPAACPMPRAWVYVTQRKQKAR